MNIELKTNLLFNAIERNISDEAEARGGYYRLIAEFGDCFSEEELDKLHEIIAEELKHSEILREMIHSRNFIVPEK